MWRTNSIVRARVHLYYNIIIFIIIIIIIIIIVVASVSMMYTAVMSRRVEVYAATVLSRPRVEDLYPTALALRRHRPTVYDGHDE